MKSLVFRACLILLSGFLLASTATQAARLENLFQSEVVVSGRDTAARNAGLRRALGEVLLRMTGNPQELQTPQAKQILRQPDRYAEQFRFLQVTETEGAGPSLHLWVQFDGVTLAKDIREAGLPYWGADRPDMLAWLAIDDRGSRYIVSETGYPGVSAILQKAAVQRGIPVTLPLMDLQDRGLVKFTDVWGGFVSGLEEASQRYRPQVMLVGTLGHSSSGRGWRSNWTLIEGTNRQDWENHASSMNETVYLGFSEAAERLAMRYAYVASVEQLRSLMVDGIEGLEDYAAVYRYLQSLTPVAGIDVARVKADEVEFNLRLNSDEQQLLQVITLGRRLEPVDDAAEWRFHYLP